MACPSEITIENLSGQYLMNKSLSDSVEPVLEIQGINFVLRKAMSKASPNITIKQSTDASGITTVVLEQSAIGMKAEDLFVLDWNPTTSVKGPVGEVEQRCRFYQTPDFDPAAVSSSDSRAFLAGGTETSAWLEDPTGKHIQIVEKDPKGQWTVEQVWGFELLDGKRYHTKRLVATNGKKEALVRWVYDYVGPL